MRPAQAFYFDSVDSTNEAAKRLIHDHRIHSPAYVVAREQTAGRGQRGRLWLSPRDAGVYLTVVDFPDSTAAPAPQDFTLGPAHAVREGHRHRKYRSKIEVLVGLKGLLLRPSKVSVHLRLAGKDRFASGIFIEERVVNRVHPVRVLKPGRHHQQTVVTRIGRRV